jgi:hypothetical protein
MNTRDLTLKALKHGNIWSRNGITIYYCAGLIAVTSYKHLVKVSTIKEAKEEIKEILNYNNSVKLTY